MGDRMSNSSRQSCGLRHPGPGEPWSTQRPTLVLIYHNDIDLGVVHLIEIQRIVGPRPTRNYGLESIANGPGTDSNARSSMCVDATYPCMNRVIGGWR